MKPRRYMGVEMNSDEFHAVQAARAQVRAMTERSLHDMLERFYGCEADPEGLVTKLADVGSVLDALQECRLVPMDLEAITLTWRSSMASYRDSEPRCECRLVGGPNLPLEGQPVSREVLPSRAKGPPRGRHCLPCGEFHLCDRCYQAHARCEGTETRSENP
jgi:hypothetical protein